MKRVIPYDLFGATRKAIYVQGKKDILKTLKILDESDREADVCIDIETYAKPEFVTHEDAALVPFKALIRTLQVYDSDVNVIFDFMDEDGSNMLFEDKSLFEKLYSFLGNNTLIAHNALFETAHFQHLVDVHGMEQAWLNIHCTMNMFNVVKHAVRDNPEIYKAGLANVCEACLQEELPKDEQRSDWSQPELTDSQLQYCARDSVVPFLIHELLLTKINKLKMQKIFLINTHAQEPVAHMRVNGITFDKAYHDELRADWETNEKKYYEKCLYLLNEKKISEVTFEQLKELLIAKVTKNRIDYAKIVINNIDNWAKATPMLRLAKVRNLSDGIKVRIQEFLEKVKDEEDSPTDNNVQKEEKRSLRALNRVLKNIEELLISPSSGKQLSDWLEANLPEDELKAWPENENSGTLKTDVDAFEANEHLEIVKPIVEFKKYSKLSSTYGKGLQPFIVDTGERHVIFPSFSLLFTGTGRMSSFKPNLQNQPRSKEFRKLYISRGENYRLLCADFGQIELRCAAYISGDAVMKQAYRKGLDLHAITGASFAGVPIEKVTEDIRQLAKAVNFGLLYGAGATTLQKYAKVSYGVDMTDAEAQHAVDAFRMTYSDYYKWQKSHSKLAKETLSVRTPLGKLRKLKEEYSYTTSMNTVIQGAAAEIMLIALCNLYEEILNSEVDAKIVNVVHDEIIVDCHETDKEEVAGFIKDSMEQALLTVFPEATTKKLVDVGCGFNWADAKAKENKLEL